MTSGVLETIFLAMTPFGELRVALPIALTIYKLPLWLAYLVSVIGNLIPPFLILFFFRFCASFLSKRFFFFQKIFNRLFSYTQKRWKESPFSFWLLVFFVAIPLPFTGAWTGALSAILFNLSFQKSFLAISLGVLIAGFIVVILTQSGIILENIFGYRALIIFIVIILLMLFFFDYFRRKNIQKRNMVE